MSTDDDECAWPCVLRLAVASAPSEMYLRSMVVAGDDVCVTLLRARQFSKRTVRVSKEMTEDAKTLLRLMGVPVIEAPTEAEAQCSALAKAGAVHAAVSEDMDTLTFGAPVMLRNVFGTFCSTHPIPPLRGSPHAEACLAGCSLAGNVVGQWREVALGGVLS